VEPDEVRRSPAKLGPLERGRLRRGVDLAARNLPGVDVIDVANLCTELLAPGGDHGRLTVFTQSALTALTEREG